MLTKIIIVSSIILITTLVGLAFYYSSPQKPTATATSYSSQDASRPQAQTDQILFDRGEIKVSDVIEQDYQLKNVGSQPLQILNVNSSCGCTAGQIIYKGETSKEYSMHTQSGYVTEIAPGDTAIVRLIYRPATMPVYGLVQREVYVSTNDPNRQKLVFGIKTTVK